MIGASVDKPDVNEKWARRLGLKMPLISDATGERLVANAFGVARPVGTAKRTTWLIEPDGELRRVYGQVSPKGHAAQVLADCRELWG